MRKKTIIRSIPAILFGIVISFGLLFPGRAIYAHTFSGNESAKFLALVKILEADANLVQTNTSSNLTSAQAHAAAVAERLDTNTTKELTERNKLVANDLTKAVADLQRSVNTTNLPPTQEAIKGKVDRINALLHEAITVRVDKNQLNNSTVKGQAVANIVDEALERYREAFGIEEGGDAAGHNTIVNIADYQSAQAIADKAQEMFNEAKQVLSTNSSSASTTSSPASTLSAITKVGMDLATFKNYIDTKTTYDKVANYMESTLDPDIKAAFKL